SWEHRTNEPQLRRSSSARARNPAAFLDVEAVQLAVWDGQPPRGEAGTGRDVEAWRRAGRATHVIAVPLADSERAPRRSSRSRRARFVRSCSLICEASARCATSTSPSTFVRRAPEGPAGP